MEKTMFNLIDKKLRGFKYFCIVLFLILPLSKIDSQSRKKYDINVISVTAERIKPIEKIYGETRAIPPTYFKRVVGYEYELTIRIELYGDNIKRHKPILIECYEDGKRIKYGIFGVEGGFESGEIYEFILNVISDKNKWVRVKVSEPENENSKFETLDPNIRYSGGSVFLK